ncbi:MAG: FMN-binding protein [Acidimicrobiales bacterium]|jgi:uncharacterized protein with FMN-binding domain
MRRAVIATAGTVVGLVALLGYRSSGAVNVQRATIGTGPSGPATPAPGATTLPSSAPTTGAPAGRAPATTSPASRTYDGQLVTYIYGNIEVAVTRAGSRVVSITVPQNSAIDGRSAMINSEAVPVLVQEALAAQGANIDVVSGATYTSDAFAQSLQSALSAAGK